MKTQFVLIDPHFLECRTQYGDDLQDAIDSFWSGHWEQGHDPDKRILDKYGDWTLYLKDSKDRLVPMYQLKDSPHIKKYF